MRVRRAPDVEPGDFEEHLRAESAVADAWLLAGDWDYELRLTCADLAELDTVVGGLRAAGGNTSTLLVLRRVPLRVQ